MKCIVRPQFYLHHEGKVFCPGEIVEWPKDEPLPAQAAETPETEVAAGLPLQPEPEKDE